MKYLFMLLTMFFMANVMPVQAQSNNSEDPDVHIIIKLEGETEDDRNKSLILPYEAWQSGQTVYVVSHNNVPDVTYTILSPSGAVVDRYTGTAVQMQPVALNASGHESGVYTLLITTPAGTYIYGTFSL